MAGIVGIGCRTAVRIPDACTVACRIIGEAGLPPVVVRDAGQPAEDVALHGGGTVPVLHLHQFAPPVITERRSPPVAVCHRHGPAVQVIGDGGFPIYRLPLYIRNFCTILFLPISQSSSVIHGILFFLTFRKTLSLLCFSYQHLYRIDV